MPSCARRLLPIGFHVGLAPRVAVVEQLVLDALLVAAADAERNHAGHVADDLADAVLDRGVRRVQPHRHVAAADVEADAGNADLLLVGDHAADRLRIAEMTVRADHAGDDVADRHAVAHLRNRGLVVLAENLERAVLEFRGLRRSRGDARGGVRGLTRHVLGARGIAKRAPDRHRALAGTIDPDVGIEAGGSRQRAGALLVGVSPLS